MRHLNKLNALEVKRLLKEGKQGRHSDGGGLYLSISKDGSRARWVFIYRWKPAGMAGTGKLKELGLGSAQTVSLARAREKATDLRGYLDHGLDPKEARKPAARMPTFGEVADALIDSKTPSWRNPKSAAQWRMTLTTYCSAIRDVPVDQITVEHVLSVLQPIWLKKPETAQRLRGRIENVWTPRISGNFAAVKIPRDIENASNTFSQSPKSSLAETTRRCKKTKCRAFTPGLKSSIRSAHFASSISF